MVESSGLPADSELYTATHSESREDGPEMIPSFGKETRREFSHSNQNFKRPTLQKVERGYDSSSCTTRAPVTGASVSVSSRPL